MAGFLTAAAVGAAISGGSKIIGGLIGRGKRKREEQAAAAELARNKEAFANFQFTNPWKNMQNTAEDLTVNTQAANFQAQEADASLAQGLDAIVAGGGGGGSAQAIAMAALRSKQGISATIAQQESSNQQIMAQQAAKNQYLEAQGEEDLQSQEYDRSGTLLNMASGRKYAATQARAEATKMIVGGVGEIGGAVGDLNFK